MGRLRRFRAVQRAARRRARGDRVTLGPLMIDLAGEALAPRERELLGVPAVGGVVLFARNYASPAQVAELVAEVRAAQHTPLLVAVDQEGGRIQRFTNGFTPLPPAALLGELYDRDRDAALQAAECVGLVRAAELRAVDVDLGFAPVLDLGGRNDNVVGRRALHADPEAVVALARAQVTGMRRAGMAAVGKHFPGHGSVADDSHVSSPVDVRTIGTIRMEDLLVFERLVESGLPAVMPAHVVYSDVDQRTACFSSVWLQRILRGELGFKGAVLSDDLGCMRGAMHAGDLHERAMAALTAGCDMALLCNAGEETADVVRRYEHAVDPARIARLIPLRGRQGEWRHAGSAAHAAAGRASQVQHVRERLEGWPAYRAAIEVVERLDPEPELQLTPD